jgi:lipoyl-dependent peroxiredoxin
MHRALLRDRRARVIAGLPGILRAWTVWSHARLSWHQTCEAYPSHFRRTFMKKTASAKWSGGIKDGKGHISTQSGVLKDAPYGFNSRFEEGPGTNPEELIGAAHAGCFTMALSLMLTQAGLTAESIETKATITLDKEGEGFAITASHLDVKVKVPGADKAKVEEAVQSAKAGCPVSKVLNANITLDAEVTV